MTAKLFTMMIIISLVPLTMFWGITLKQAKNRIRYEAQKDIGRQFVSTMRTMDAWFYEKVRLLESLAETDDIVSMDNLRQKHLLNAFHTMFPEMSSLFIIDLNGSNKIIASRNSKRQYLEKNFFKGIMSGKALTWQTGINPKTKKPDLILAVSIETKNQLSGILVNVFSLKNITKQFSEMEPGPPGLALLVKNKGKIFIDKNNNYVKGLKKMQWHPLIAKFRSGQNGLMSFTDLTGNPIFGYVEKTSFGWGIALQSEEKRSVLMIKQLMSFAYLLLAITVVFVFIIAWFSGRALSRPIIKLTETADRISVGALDLEIRTQRKDELGELAEAIARMQDSIRLSIERLRRRH
ncbi:MAG: HAMP domain-containing protein [Deltaproteobacteria bacterium]|nr:HAMP domain-containing protein [Deltaproteobacteria bacterium]